MARFTIDREINVTAVRFGGKDGFETMPSRIEFDGESYSLTEAMKYHIRSGDRITRLLDMTDGARMFRLRSDSDRSGWRLMSMSV